MNLESQPLSLRMNFTWTFAGNLIYAACQWVTLMLLAKLTDAVMLGQFAMGLAISAPVYMLANLSLRNALVTDVQHRYPFGVYLGLRLITVPSAVLLVAGVALAGGYGSDTVLVVLAVALAKALESMSLLFHGFLQRQERMDRVGKSLMLKGLMSPIGMGLLLGLTGEVLYGTLAMAAGWGLILLAYDIPGVSRLLSGGAAPQDSLRPGLGAGNAGRLFLTALPLGLTFMLAALNTNIPRYFFSEHDLGIFAAVASLPVLGTTVILSLGQASIARLARYFAAGDGAAFRRLLLRLIGLATLLGVAGLLLALVAGRQILRLLFTEEIAGHTRLLVLLVIAAIVEFNAAILGVAVTATRAFSHLLVAYAFIAAAALALSFVLIPALGLTGAAWALFGTYLIICLAMAILLAMIWHRKTRTS